MSEIAFNHGRAINLNGDRFSRYEGHTLDRFSAVLRVHNSGTHAIHVVAVDISSKWPPTYQSDIRQHQPYYEAFAVVCTFKGAPFELHWIASPEGTTCFHSLAKEDSINRHSGVNQLRDRRRGIWSSGDLRQERNVNWFSALCISVWRSLWWVEAIWAPR